MKLYQIPIYAALLAAACDSNCLMGRVSGTVDNVRETPWGPSYYKMDLITDGGDTLKGVSTMIKIPNKTRVSGDTDRMTFFGTPLNLEAFVHPDSS